MYCLKCGQLNQDDVKFCISCGEPLGQQPVEPAEEETASVEVTPGTCPNCGYVNEPDVKFCQNCGTGMTGAAASTVKKEKKKSHIKMPEIGAGLNLKKILVAAGSIVAAVLVIVLLSSLFRSGNYIECKNSLFYYYADNEYRIGLSDGKLNIMEAYSLDITSNLDGTKAMLFSNGERELYYFDGASIIQVAEDVMTYEMSADGSALIYTIEADELYDLYIYSGRKSTLVASEVAATCISPDGKTVGYIGGRNEETDSFKGYIWDGSVKEIGKNKVPFALSNGGKYVYYTKFSSDDNTGTLYVQKGDKDDTKEKIGEAGELDEFYLNSDGTQAMLVGYGKTYVSIKGGERVKVASSGCMPILPENTQVFYGDAATTLGIKSFAEMCYVTESNSSGNKLIYLSKDFESSTAANNVGDYYFLADDGKTLYFLKGDSVRKINASKSGSSAETLVEDDVRSFCISQDGKTIFFVTDDGELYGLKGEKKMKLLTDDLDGYLAYSLFKGDTIYYISDGELYSSTGEKSTKISGFSGDVTNIYGDNFRIVVSCSDDGDSSVYLSSNGKNFTLVVQE